MSRAPAPPPGIPFPPARVLLHESAPAHSAVRLPGVRRIVLPSVVRSVLLPEASRAVAAGCGRARRRVGAPAAGPYAGVRALHGDPHRVAARAACDSAPGPGPLRPARHGRGAVRPGPLRDL